MITVWGEGRGFRVVWLLEEMGLPYRLRPVDLLAGAENDPEFLAINPAGFIPALQDGDTVIVESIAILDYLTTCYGPTPLALAPSDPAYGKYQQFLHLGEAGLMGFAFMMFADTVLAPEDRRGSWLGGYAGELFESRRSIVARQLAAAPYMAGELFSAADISVVYALEFAQRNAGLVYSEAERSYIARVTRRDGYGRAMDSCAATKAWVGSLADTARA